MTFATAVTARPAERFPSLVEAAQRRRQEEQARDARFDKAASTTVYKRSPRQPVKREAIRARAAELRAEGLSYLTIGSRLGVSEETARVALMPKQCGTVGGYRNGCRCAACKGAQTEKQRAFRERQKQERGGVVRGPKHGTTNAYRHHKCRCEPCVAAMTAERLVHGRAARGRKRAAAEQARRATEEQAESRGGGL